MPRPDLPSVLGGMSPTAFLKNHWQKEPLVVRGAFPGLRDPLTPDELAGLACSPGVDSRLVMERGGRKPWLVQAGPQRERVLRGLPRSHWTLLVESVDRFSPQVAGLAEAFSFLPRWRMDDVMVSLAPRHGTVGAHVDSYDVFLIQGQGRRRWEVDRRSRPEYRPGLDVRILKRFLAQESWILNPGDMLYVPPGVGHRGVTVESRNDVAITYSVGFRAPSTADLLSSLLRRELGKESSKLFEDRGRGATGDADELSATDLFRLRRFVEGELRAVSDDEWALVAGEAVTAGGRGSRPGRGLSLSEVEKRLARGAMVRPAPGARLAWSRAAGGQATLLINGEGRLLPRRQAFLAPLFCGRDSAAGRRRLAGNEKGLKLLVDLLRAGVVRLVA